MPRDGARERGSDIKAGAKLGMAGGSRKPLSFAAMLERTPLAYHPQFEDGCVVRGDLRSQHVQADRTGAEVDLLGCGRSFLEPGSAPAEVVGAFTDAFFDRLDWRFVRLLLLSTIDFRLPDDVATRLAGTEGHRQAVQAISDAIDTEWGTTTDESRSILGDLTEAPQP